MAWVILTLFFAWTNFTVVDVTWISLIIGVISYLIGDLWLLPRVNNTVATVADFGLAAIVIGWIAIQWFGMDVNTINVGLIFGSAVFIAVGEWILHVYYQRKVLKQPI
ncbi:hypothetical protein CHM34_13065 [Paludifilum halophilum]|uniref:DUF2512 domain-containing protein n=2 Tax=Paludifilum halophilum TaxID=1642702 RepID=A0A235B3J0_9BACL|nr:hypothetical protein CHM34_13065 [Paludifilum halophilum]